MKKHIAIAALLLGTSLISGTASAYTIDDTTDVLEGHSRSANNDGWKDVIGDPLVFQVFGVNVTRGGGQITFDLFANLQQGGMSLTAGSDTYKYYMADFAIDANRDGSFEHGVVLEDHDSWAGLVGLGVVADGAGSHDVGLYSGTSWRNSTYFNEESAGTGGVGYGEKYANGVAVLDPLVAVNTGTFKKPISLLSSAGDGDGTTGSLYKYSFTLDESDLGLTSTSLDPAIFWAGATCSNDAINNAPVPEPASMLLLGTGIAGLIGAKRRARRKA